MTAEMDVRIMLVPGLDAGERAGGRVGERVRLEWATNQR